jgi:hypothetical protein
MMVEHNISDQLGELLEKAVEIDLDHLRNARPIQPWILTQANGQYSMSIISGFEFESAMNEARRKVAGQALEIDAYSIGFDGTIPTTDGPVKGLFYEIAEKGQKNGYQYMIGYRILEKDKVEILEDYNGVLKDIPNLIYQNGDNT